MRSFTRTDASLPRCTRIRTASGVMFNRSAASANVRCSGERFVVRSGGSVCSLIVPSIIAAADIECNNTAAADDAGCDDAPESSPLGSLEDSEEELAVSQRTLIYIVGAIILILVIAYFLGIFGGT